MGYLDIFEDPLAPMAATANDKDGLPQMQRNAPAVAPSSDPTLKEQALDYAKNKAMGAAEQKGNEFFSEKVMPKAKDFFSMFSPDKAAAASNAGTASSLANQAAMTEAAGLTASKGAELAASKMAEQAGLNALVSSGGTGAVTSGAAAGGAGAGAAMAAAAPYVAAGLVADEILGLGLREKVLGFSKGGRAGPLYAAEGKPAYPSYRGSYNEMSNDELSKMLDSMSSKEKEEYIKTIGLEEAMDAMYQSSGNKIEDSLIGPLAIRKIKYKQDGGKIEIEATMGD